MAHDGRREWQADLRDPPADDALTTLLAEVAPGGVVERVVRLRGGISTAMHRVDVRLRSGELDRLVVRRYVPRTGGVARASARVGTEAAILGVLETVTVPAPVVRWVDVGGHVLGSPALVLTFLAGDVPTTIRSDERDSWTGDLAAHVAAIHDVDLTHLPELTGRLPSAEDDCRARLGNSSSREWIAGHDRADDYWRAIELGLAELQDRTHRLLHGDLWTGNLLRTGDRLTGIVDWAGASLGPPAHDLGSLSVDAWLTAGRGAADELVAAYESVTGTVVAETDVALWRLDNVYAALGAPDAWATGFADLGRPDLDAAHITACVDEILDDALDVLGVSRRARP